MWPLTLKKNSFQAVSQTLGKVTGDLQAERGPDVELRVTVERAWFGSKVGITLPRNLNCAACSGGGCDRCARAGAVSLWTKGGQPRAVQVVLPDLPESNCDVCLRVPGEGGPAREQELGRGHLMLMVRPGEMSDQGVVLCESGATLSDERFELMKRSLIMALVLVLLFLGMLRLSGWL